MHRHTQILLAICTGSLIAPLGSAESVLSRDEKSSLLALTPVTGRSHQLRIHMREIGHPILGCDFYAPEAVLNAAPRLLLHATSLRFSHPVSGEVLTARSPAPAVFYPS